MPRTLAYLAAAAALATSSFPFTASAATTQSENRTMTRLAAQILSDASAAQMALASQKTGGEAETEIDRALAARNQLATQARAAGLPMVAVLHLGDDR
jgi:hypothetical protein